MNILVIYNGSSGSKLSLREGIGQIKKHGGKLIVLYVFRRDYDKELCAGRKSHLSKKAKKDKKKAHSKTLHHEVIARDEASRHINDAKRILEKKGEEIKSDIITTEESPADEITRCVREKNIDIIFSANKRYRLNYEINCSS